jgi:hypothetical protein
MIIGPDYHLFPIVGGFKLPTNFLFTSSSLFLSLFSLSPSPLFLSSSPLFSLFPSGSLPPSISEKHTLILLELIENATSSVSHETEVTLPAFFLCVVTSALRRYYRILALAVGLIVVSLFQFFFVHKESNVSETDPLIFNSFFLTFFFEDFSRYGAFTTAIIHCRRYPPIPGSLPFDSFSLLMSLFSL